MVFPLLSLPTIAYNIITHVHYCMQRGMPQPTGVVIGQSKHEAFGSDHAHAWRQLILPLLYITKTNYRFSLGLASLLAISNSRFSLPAC
ncbi:hypothetical protein SeMB42_g08024 [Synchytrium endobioticum]|uniref:Uncharacterized protein n=1 Tax=Synchytrium endobioticum TaxID=286115 RepID=A0A507DHY9_9FUNG|nr:hypothetical protein SeMB42_g08024 [Synchytrium endobioticum]TPX50847.1 hypothetical protein SeLEV6574_g00673 [Synchytrium endobioticum]